MVHFGKAEEVIAKRQRTMDEIWAKHPERFVNGRPVVPSPPKEVWINRPKNEEESENAPLFLTPKCPGFIDTYRRTEMTIFFKFKCLKLSRTRSFGLQRL